MVVKKEEESYPLSEVMDIEKSNLTKTNEFKKNLKNGIYKELYTKGLISEQEFIILTTSACTSEVGHAIMH